MIISITGLSFMTKRIKTQNITYKIYSTTYPNIHYDVMTFKIDGMTQKINQTEFFKNETCIFQ